MSSNRFRRKQIESLGWLETQGVISMLHEREMTPCFILNKQHLLDRLALLQAAMPDVTPHYAVKSCPMPEVLEILKSVDARLDVASKGEIELLKAVNYPANLLVHTHPHKTPADMKAAYDYGIRTFVLDDISEIAILEPYKKDIVVLTRLGFSNSSTSIDLSYKFGLNPDKVMNVIAKLVHKGFTVAGCTFHVGSQTLDPKPYAVALVKTAAIYNEYEKTYGHRLSMLDIGGGFPTEYTEHVPTIDAFAEVINPLLEEHFRGTRVISEPGRFIINPCVTLATRVTSITKRDSGSWLFTDDGVYGGFADMLSGHARYLLLNSSELRGSRSLKPYTVAGPTCDSIDVIDTKAMLPTTKIGDILLVPNMGAYSFATASEFNSIPKTGVIVV